MKTGKDKQMCEHRNVYVQSAERELRKPAGAAQGLSPLF